MITQEQITTILNTPKNERTADQFTVISKWMREERKRLIASGVDKKRLSISPIGVKKEWIAEYDKIKVVLKTRFYEIKDMVDTLFESTISDEKPKGQQYIHLHLSTDTFPFDLVLQNPLAKKDKKKVIEPPKEEKLEPELSNFEE